MPLRLHEFSRFKDTEPIIKDGRETFGLWSRPRETDLRNLKEEDRQTIRVTQLNAGRPDLIATEVYGSPLLEWIIVMSNRPRQTVGWPFAGTEITIPRRNVVTRLL